MKKRLVSLALVLVMIFGILPLSFMSVSAAKSDKIYVAGVLMKDGDYLANGSSSTQTSKPSNGYAFYKDGVLTLRNFKYTGQGYYLGDNDYALILSYTNLRINLEGKNELVGSFPGSAIYGYGIKVSLFLYISGEGSLDIHSIDGIEAGGVSIVDTNLNIITNGSGIVASNDEIYLYKSQVNIAARYYTILNTNGDITIIDSALIAYTDLQRAIYTPGKLQINYGYTQLSRGSSAYELIYAGEIISPTASIWATTDTTEIELAKFEKYDDTKAPQYNTIVIEEDFESAKVNVGGITMTAKTYLASGTKAVSQTKPTGVGYAYFDGKTLTFKNFSYSGGGNIYSNSHLEIVLEGKNEITVTTATTAGIFAECGLAIRGNGNLDIKADYPILVRGGVYINDATIIATSTSYYAITAQTQNVEINNATFYAYGSAGILTKSGYDVKINSSYVVISVDQDGIYSNGALYIDDSYTDIRSLNTSDDWKYGSVFASEYIYFSNYENLYASQKNYKVSLEPFLYENCTAYDYISTTRAVLNYIDIVNIALPETLALPDFTAKADSAYTEIVSVQWYSLDDNGKISNELKKGNTHHYFSYGQQYRVYVTVRAAKGKEFGDTMLSAYIGDEAVISYSTSTANAKERVLYRDFVATNNPDNYTITLDNIVLKDGEYLADNGTTPTTTQPSGGYAYYKDGILTLNNFKSKNRGLRFTESYLKIKMMGSNKLSCINDNSANDDKPYELQIYGEGYLYVNGIGETEGYAFNVKNAIYFSEGEVDLDDEIYGFKTEKVYIGGADVYSYVSQGGAFCGECVLKVESGSFRVFDGGGWGQNINDKVDIQSGDVYVSNDGSGNPDNASAWDGKTSLNAYEDIWVLPEGAFIYVDDIKLKNKQYLAEGVTAPSASKPSSGRYAYFEVVDGKNILTLNNYNPSNEVCYAIYSDKGLTIKTTGNNSLSSSEYGICVFGNLIMDNTNGALDIDSVTCGIYAIDGNITINGGDINITAEHGIYSTGNLIELNGGKINIDAKYDGISIWAVENSNADIVINGGEITIYSEKEDGLDSNYGNIIINEGRVTVTNSDCCAIEGYNVYINGGEILFGSATETDGIFASEEIKISDGSIKTTGDGNALYNAIYCETLKILGGYMEIYGQYVIDTVEMATASSLNPMASVNMDGSNLVEFDFNNMDEYSYFVCGKEIVPDPDDNPNPDDVPETEYLLGDVDNDGDVDADDYIILKRVYFGVTKLENLENPKTALVRSDVHGGDGVVTADDYILLKRVFFGMAKIG